MEELGSYPRIRFGDASDHNQYTRDADQSGSWFGLALSGLKFLMTPTPIAATQSPAPHTTRPKPHILGPCVFKKQLYDIEEEEEGHAPLPSLTQQALRQFNGNFSNYWNQRSSLHSGHSDHTLSDGGASSSTTQQDQEMTSSQIIHPSATQLQRGPPQLKHSASFPLLHSAEYRHSLEHFAATNPATSRENEHNADVEGSTTSLASIPSPPAISATPELGSGLLLGGLKGVQPIKSWGSVGSHSVRSVDRESVRSNQSNRSDIVFVGGVSSRQRGVSQGAERAEDGHDDQVGDTSGSTLVHVHNGSKEPSEVGWEESVGAMKKRTAADEENVCFSDWSNVSWEVANANGKQ